MNDTLFADPVPAVRTSAEHAPWLVLVVDDEEDMHAVTKLVLGPVKFEQRGLTLLHAYSAADAKELLAKHPDIALILLDVVMETEDAGLRLVEHVRKELRNDAVRIILRTGQPGMAPERRVIVEYDINDYKSKIELSAQKLFTTTLAALRAYAHIRAVEMSREGLQKIISGAGSLFRLRSINMFSTGVLTQISALLGISRDGILCVWEDVSSLQELYVFASSGEFEELGGSPFNPESSGHVGDAIRETFAARESRFGDLDATLYFDTPHARRVVVYLRTRRPLRAFEKQLLEVFCRQISIGIDNLHLFDQVTRSNVDLKRAHKATVLALADLAEHRDEQTGEHVLRVARLAEDLTDQLARSGYYPEIDAAFRDAIGLASIMHDVGKVTTPDRILLKPGALESDELAVMRQHTVTGRDILNRARVIAEGSIYLELGAQIAFNHHEWWDGGGYPSGIHGHEIPLAARIVSVADVFDALMHERPYKKAWALDDALAYIRSASGTQFDPAVVDAFFALIGDDRGVRYLTLG